MRTSHILTEHDKREIKRLKADGVPEYKIAAIMGVAPNTVRYHLRNCKQNKPDQAARVG